MEEKIVEIVVDNRVRMREADLRLGVSEKLQEAHSHRNPMHFKLKRFGFKAWKEPAIVRTWKETEEEDGSKTLSLPRGGTGRVRTILAEAGQRWRFVDRRTEGDRALARMDRPLPEHRLKLWEHQERIVAGVLRRENCVVRSGTGSGKTTALLAAISRAQVPALVVVWETGLLRQWCERIEKELGLSGDEIGRIGGGEFRLRPITVAMQQSLNRLDERRWDVVRRAFGFLAADELSRFAAKTFQKTIDRFPARYRIGASADETRKDGKEFLIYDLFGAVETEVSTSELVDAGIVHDVEVRIVPSEFSAPWYVAEREEFQAGGEGPERPAPPNFRRLAEEMLADEERNRLVVSTVAEATAEGRQALVFVQRIEHARKIDSMLAAIAIRSGMMVGEEGEVYVETVEGLRSGTRTVGVGTFGKIAMGLDLPAVAAGVIAAPCHNNRQQFGQVAGRLCRTTEGKTDAVLYYVWDRKVHGLLPLRNIRRWSRRVFVRRSDGHWLSVGEYLAEAKKGRVR